MALGRAILFFLICGVWLSPATVAAAREQSKNSCRGENILAELRSRERGAYTGIISQAIAIRNTGAVLWRIGSLDRPTSYLFGTVHLTDDRVTKLSPRVQSALAEVNTLAVEISDLSEAATNAAIAEATDVAIFTSGKNLKDLLNESEFKTVKSRLAAAGMPPAMAPSLKPWLVNMILSVTECERRKTQGGTPVLDSKLADLARKRGINVVSLESIAEQLRALAALTLPQQTALLRATLSQSDRADDLQETVVQLYTSRRIGATLPLQIELADKAGISSEPFDAFAEQVLVNRNRRMLEKARPLLDRGGVMIAVGALHLGGTQGLVDLLRDEGFAVTPIE